MSLKISSVDNFVDKLGETWGKPMAKWVKVAVPGPFYEGFDYAVPSGADEAWVGCRVQVPLGRRSVVGVVIAVLTETQIDPAKIKAITARIDSVPLFQRELFGLLDWVARYYHHPLGDCLDTAMPKRLCEGAPFVSHAQSLWVEGEATGGALKRAPKQQQALEWLAEHPEGVTRAEWAIADIDLSTVKALQRKGLIREQLIESLPVFHTPTQSHLTLNAEQQQALQAIDRQRFHVTLLEGVTGSGKTEVYLQLIDQVLEAGQQALVLVPEIGLTPQTVERFRKRFARPVIMLHSNLTETEKVQHWVWASNGEAGVVIGTRSAVFTPFKALGVIVVDEEHDLSFKQQTGLRYSARDVAIKRAQLSNIPIVLGSATPALETFYQAHVAGRFHPQRLSARAGAAKPPSFYVIDMRQQPLINGLSRPLLEACRQHLQQGGQVLLFLNRRGYAPVLMCHECGWAEKCTHCDGYLTLHRSPLKLLCHHCLRSKPVVRHCPSCEHGDSIVEVGVGTERVEEALLQQFPEHKVVRIDRGVTGHKGALDALLAEVHSGAARILVGTQMLAKGHHFVGITMVGVINADSGLLSSDFRAIERMGQLIVQVAGRAGREERPGEVYIQTHQPQHPLLLTLLEEGYPAFAKQVLAERQAAHWPPFGFLALIRAEALQAPAALGFLQTIKHWLADQAALGLTVLGPIPATLHKKADYHRAQLLLLSTERAVLHNALAWLVPQLAELAGRAVRFAVDVDPQEVG